MSGDNFHFDMTGVPLADALKIAFCGSPGNKAVGWSVLDADDTETVEGQHGHTSSRKRLVLFWHESGGGTPLPAPMDAEAAIPFIKAWLAEADYGKQPDHDGDNGKGWRIYNEAWGHVARNHYAFVAIEPEWIMYGK